MFKKIVFMGTSYFAVPILKSLYQNGYPISVVYTQPPKKSNRGQKLNKSPINLFSETISLNVRTPKVLKNNNEEELYLSELKPDLVIVVSYGQIIPQNLLKIPKNGFLNVHASLLPKWRGAAPIQRSIMNLDKETGISIMKIKKNLDSGPVCNSYKIDITENDNFETLSNKLSILAAEKISDIVQEILDDKLKFEDQNHEQASYAGKIEKSEGKIDWNKPAESIIGKINGLYPDPGAWFIYNGERYKILKAKVSDRTEIPGIVLDNYLEISCSDKSVKILEIQRQGRKSQNINEFVLGSQIKKGSNLNNV